MMAAIKSANTMAKPALLPTCRISSTGKQRDDAEGDRARGRQNAEQIEHARPDHGEICRQRPRIDDGRNRVRGVVKAVDELEAERDQKRDEQQQEWRVAS